MKVEGCRAVSFICLYFIGSVYGVINRSAAIASYDGITGNWLPGRTLAAENAFLERLGKNS